MSVRRADVSAPVVYGAPQLVIAEPPASARVLAIAARLAHESQSPDPVAVPTAWRSRAAELGRVAQVELAEAFTVLRLD